MLCGWGDYTELKHVCSDPPFSLERADSRNFPSNPCVEHQLGPTWMEDNLGDVVGVLYVDPGIRRRTVAGVDCVQCRGEDTALRDSGH